MSGLLHKAVCRALLFSLTLSGFPADQQVEGAHGAKGDLLGQIVDGEGPSVPEHHRLAQQGSGRAQLELIPLQNHITFHLCCTSPYVLLERLFLVHIATSVLK